MSEGRGRSGRWARASLEAMETMVSRLDLSTYRRKAVRASRVE